MHLRHVACGSCVRQDSGSQPIERVTSLVGGRRVQMYTREQEVPRGFNQGAGIVCTAVLSASQPRHREAVTGKARLWREHVGFLAAECAFIVTRPRHRLRVPRHGTRRHALRPTGDLSLRHDGQGRHPRAWQRAGAPRRVRAIRALCERRGPMGRQARARPRADGHPHQQRRDTAAGREHRAHDALYAGQGFDDSYPAGSPRHCRGRTVVLGYLGSRVQGSAPTCGRSIPRAISCSGR